jgi:PAS domain-containing protein
MEESELLALSPEMFQRAALPPSESDQTGMVLQLTDGKIQACNRAAEMILGFTLEQLQGCDSFDCMWQAIHEDGSPFPGETHLLWLRLLVDSLFSVW